VRRKRGKPWFTPNFGARRAPDAFLNPNCWGKNPTVWGRKAKKGKARQSRRAENSPGREVADIVKGETVREPATGLIPEVLSRQHLQHLNWSGLGALARARKLAGIRRALIALFRDAQESPAHLNAIAAALSPELAAELRTWGLGKRVPSGNELDEIAGTWMGLAGIPISGRMVRRYLTLLSLPHSVQEAACSLKECQLRPLLRLKEEALQLAVVKAILSTQEARSTPLRPWSFPSWRIELLVEGVRSGQSVEKALARSLSVPRSRQKRPGGRGGRRKIVPTPGNRYFAGLALAMVAIALAAAVRHRWKG